VSAYGRIGDGAIEPRPVRRSGSVALTTIKAFGEVGSGPESHVYALPLCRYQGEEIRPENNWDQNR
jgi:hypothetical protein